MVRKFATIVAAISLLSLLLPFAASAEKAPPGDSCEMFDATGFSICNEFLDFWNANGGLEVFGYPLTDAHDEVNPDTGQTLLVQYFERQRFELHPENAGTVYNVLFGRLGAQTLEMQGRDWMTFPKADSGADHYFEVTGHAIAPQFWGYWSSHGLDYGDEGISLRESLLLFGYPISEPAMETNSDGDTVLTQWFERAVFEYHPNNEDQYKVLLRRVGAELLESMTPQFDVVTDGLNSPRGIAFDASGAMYLTDAGSPDAASPDDCIQVGDPADDLTVCFADTGSVIKVVNGTATTVASGLPGTIGDIEISPSGDIYVLTGLGADPSQVRPIAGDKANGFGAILKVDTASNTWTVVADVSGYEVEANPDDGAIDTNPYGFTMVDGGFMVADAGANAVFSVTAEGVVSTFAAFPPQMVDAPPFLGMDPGAQIPMESVPTAVAQGPDGAFYVSELTGFPFNVGAARIWRVADTNGDGDALDDGEMTVFADGFTNLVDLAFDDLGHLYALEIASGGLLAAEGSEDPAAFAGAVVRVEADGSHTVIADNGLIAPTGMAINGSGIYVANFGVMPGMGQIVKLRATASSVAVVATGLNGPRGMTVTSDGTVYVAEAGTAGDACASLGEGDDAVNVCAGATGAITRVANGTQEQVVTGLPSVTFGEGATGPHDVVVGDMGQLYTVVGLGSSAENRDTIGPALVGDAASEFGTILAINEDGSWQSIADVSAYESEANPDGGAIDSNPFSLVLTESGFIVSDAGMNAVVNVHPAGDDTTFETMGVIADRMVDAPPFLGLPEGTQIPMQGVPTGIVQGPDGAYYVGELTGFPFEIGAARVWRIAGPDNMSVVAEGFTNILDIAFDSHGNMYVLEMFQNGLLSANPDDPSTLTGALIKVAPDGTKTTVMSNGLVTPTGMAIGSDDSIYISNFGEVPGMGQVIKINQ